MKHFVIVFGIFVAALMLWATFNNTEKERIGGLLWKYKGSILLLLLAVAGLSILFVFAVMTNPIQLF